MKFCRADGQHPYATFCNIQPNQAYCNIINWRSQAIVIEIKDSVKLFSSSREILPPWEDFSLLHTCCWISADARMSAKGTHVTLNRRQTTVAIVSLLRTVLSALRVLFYPYSCFVLYKPLYLCFLHFLSNWRVFCVAVHYRSAEIRVILCYIYPLV
jgi:hypothetical protein